MKRIIFATAVLMVMIAAGPAQAEKCPVGLTKADGLHATCTDPQKGDPGPKGEPGYKGDKGDPGEDFDPDALDEGLATLSALHVPHVEKNAAASLVGGFHNGKTALGFGAGVRFDETWQFGGSLAVGTEGGDVAGKAALTGQW